jgi:CTP:molybdopterin cytidylyltransferase MocA
VSGDPGEIARRAQSLLPFREFLLLDRVIENVAQSMLEEVVVILGHEAGTIRRKINYRGFKDAL